MMLAKNLVSSEVQGFARLAGTAARRRAMDASRPMQ